MSAGSQLLDELVELYAEVDEAYAATSCPGTTECCRFGRTGREPNVTGLELALIERAIAARGGAYPKRPKTLHSSRPELPVVSDERACALLGPEGRCFVYAERPLGCRTFFCDRATSLAPVKQKERTAMVNRLKDLAQRHPRGTKGGPCHGSCP